MADTAAPSPLPQTRPPLVGRDRERALLRDHLSGALAGRGALVLIGGEAGIGKTALAEATLRGAQPQGALALIGRCYDLAETPPYGPWAELFERLPAGHDRAALPVPLGDGEAVASQAALFARVRDTLGAAAKVQPLLLLLDDLHWADPASLDLLRHLGRQQTALPALLLVTYRSDELTRRHPLAHLLPMLVREAHATLLDLHPLDDAAVLALVRARYGPGPDEGRLVAYLRAHAEGNAFYIGELLRALEEEGLLRGAGEGWALGELERARVPTLLRHVIEARVARLGEEAHRLLAVAAVIGQEAPLGVWATVGEVGDEAVLAVVERAAEAHLLEPTAEGTGARFAHALVREALYEGMLPPRRRALHLRTGEALAAQPGPDPDAVAYHLRQAGDPRAAEWLLRAGERARRAYAWLTAADRYEAALRLLDQQGAGAAERGWLLLHLAALRRYSDPRQGLAYIEEAAHLGAASDDRGLIANALWDAGLLRCFLGETRRGLVDLEAGANALEALSPAEQSRVEVRLGLTLGLERGTLAFWLALTGCYDAARRTGEAVATRTPDPRAVRGAGASSLGDAHLGLQCAYAALGRPQDARLAYARARDAYHAAEHFSNVGRTALLALCRLALRYAADDLAERQRLAEEAETAWGRASGGVVAPFPAGMARVPLLALEGRWAEARALGPQAPDDWLVTPLLTPPLAALAREQGEPALAWRLIGGWLPDGPRTAPGEKDPLAVAALGELAAALALDAGDLATARAWLELHDRWLEWGGAVLGRAEGQLGWAAYHRAGGDLERASEHTERALAHATEPRQPLALLAAHRLLGELETAAGRHGDAAERLDQALALAEACAAPYERALALLALAELRRATGERDGAEAALGEARAVFARLEARPALARAEALAVKLAAMEPTPPTYPAGLSAREAEVLRLVAQGLTNAQVAARLFISPATVNSHLTAIYGKLGVPSRGAAIRFALDHGLR